MTYICAVDTPLGAATAASDGDAITGFWFDGQAYDRARLPKDATGCAELAVFERLTGWVRGYFAGENPARTFALAPVGTAFQREIWAMLREIPYGETTTYGALAREYARSHGLAHMSARAVGGAAGHNPISLLIPCHRVLGASGALTGYAGGTDKKIALLRLEGGGV